MRRRRRRTRPRAGNRGTGEPRTRLSTRTRTRNRNRKKVLCGTIRKWTHTPALSEWPGRAWPRSAVSGSSRVDQHAATEMAKEAVQPPGSPAASAGVEGRPPVGGHPVPRWPPPTVVATAALANGQSRREHAIGTVEQTAKDRERTSCCTLTRPSALFHTLPAGPRPRGRGNPPPPLTRPPSPCIGHNPR